MVYKARIDSITLVDGMSGRVDIGITFFRDAEEFPGPVISLPADTGTKEQAIALIKDAIIRFRAGYLLEAVLQAYIGTEILLD